MYWDEWKEKAFIIVGIILFVAVIMYLVYAIGILNKGRKPEVSETSTVSIGNSDSTYDGGIVTNVSNLPKDYQTKEQDDVKSYFYATGNLVPGTEITAGNYALIQLSSKIMPPNRINPNKCKVKPGVYISVGDIFTEDNTICS